MKKIKSKSNLPVFDVTSLLKDRKLTYGQLSNRLNVSRTAVFNAVNGRDNSSPIRLGVAKILGFKPSLLWQGVFDEETLDVDDFKYSRLS